MNDCLYIYTRNDCEKYSETRVKWNYDPFCPCPIHNTQSVFVYIILRSSTVASLPYFVFRNVSVLFEFMQSNIFFFSRLCGTMGTLPAFILILLDLVANALEIGSQTNIFMCWLSFFPSLFLYIHPIVYSTCALHIENVALFCVLLSWKPQPCFSHCDLVGDFLFSAVVHLAIALHDITY